MNPEFDEIVARILEAFREAFPADSRSDNALKNAFIEEMANQSLFIKALGSKGFRTNEIDLFMQHTNLGL